jgi:outer membrane protein assembly factor BamD (BamD/ComL family)
MSIVRLQIIGLILLMFITGCSSTSDLNKSAEMHSKAGDYYQAIGQNHAAREEYQQADKTFDRANNVFPLLVDLFEHVSKDN